MWPRGEGRRSGAPWAQYRGASSSASTQADDPIWAPAAPRAPQDPASGGVAGPHRPSLTTHCALWVPVAGTSDAESAARPKHRIARNHAGHVGLKKPLPAEPGPRSAGTPARTREPGRLRGLRQSPADVRIRVLAPPIESAGSRRVGRGRGRGLVDLRRAPPQTGQWKS